MISIRGPFTNMEPRCPGESLAKVGDTGFSGNPLAQKAPVLREGRSRPPRPDRGSREYDEAGSSPPRFRLTTDWPNGLSDVIRSRKSSRAWPCNCEGQNRERRQFKLGHGEAARVWLDPRDR